MKNKSNKFKSILALTLGTTFGLASIPAISVGSLFKSSAAERDIPYTSSQKTITNGNFETVGSTLTGWENQRIESLYDLTKNNVNTTISGIVNVSSAENFEESLKSLMGTTNSSNYNTFIDQYESFYKNIYPSEPVPTYEMPSYPNKYSSEEEKTTSALMISAGYVQNTESRVYLNGSKLGGSEVFGHVTISLSEVQVDGKNSFPVIGKNFTYTPQSGITGSQTFTYHENTELDSTDPKRHCWINNKDTTVIYYNDYVNAIGENKVYETYTSSSDLQLSNDCYFKLTFRVYTTSRDDEYNTENKLSASIKLLGDFKDNENSTFENINTYSASKKESEWAEYTYYIATNYGTSGVNKTRIQLSLGSANNPSKGTVFFDDVELQEIQSSEFYKEKAKSSISSESSTNVKVIDMKEGKIETISNFEDSSSTSSTPISMEQFGWEWDSSTSGAEDSFKVIEETSKTKFSAPTFNDDNHCLQVSNPTASALKFTTKKATVQPFKYYKISLWSRYDYNDPDLLKNASSFTHDKFSITLNGTLNGKTVSSKSYDIDPYNENQVKTDSTGHVNNFWTKTSFYIQACPVYETEIWFSISVPKNSLFLFDNYTLEEITSSEYTSATDRKLALTSTLPTETIANGFFFTQESDKTDAGLYSPSKWTFSKGDYAGSKIYYLVDGETTKVLKEADLTITADKITYKKDGINDFEYNKDNIVNNKYTYLSESSHPSSSSIYVIDSSEIINGLVVGKNYQNTIDGTMVTKNDTTFVNPENKIENYLVINNTNELIKPKFTYLSEKFSLSSGTFRAIKVFVYSELNTPNAKINLLNSSSEVIGTIDVKEHENTKNTNNWTEYTFFVKGGISSENLYLQIQYGDGKTNTTGALLVKTVYSSPSSENVYKEKQNLKISDLLNQNTKVVNLAGSTFTEVGDEITENSGKYNSLNMSIVTEENSSDADLYVLDTSIDANASYKYADTTSQFALVMKNNVNTKSVAKLNQSFSIEKSSYYKFTVVAKAMDVTTGSNAQISFTNLNSKLAVDSNEFKEYTFYLATGTDSVTTTCEFILENCIGTLVVDSISVEKLTESTYTSGIATINDETPNVTKIDFRKNTSTDEDLPDAEKTNKTLEILFATLSSLLLVVALIIALVFTRLSGKKKRTRGKKNKVEVSDADEQKGFV